MHGHTQQMIDTYAKKQKYLKLILQIGIKTNKKPNCIPKPNSKITWNFENKFNAMSN